MDCSALKTCNTCKKSLPRSEFISESRPSSTTVTCRSCRERGRKATNKYNAKKQSKTQKKSPSKKRPKKSSPVNYSSDDQESSSSISCTTITRVPRKPLCNQDLGTLLLEQKFMCSGPDKTVSPNNYCLNNDAGRSIAVLNNIDHIEKYAEGGSNKLVNLQLLCPNCHAYKCSLERKSEYGQSMTKEERESLIFFTKPKEIYD